MQKSEDINGVGTSNKNDSGAPSPSPSFPPRLLTLKIPDSHTPIWSDIIPKNRQINNTGSSEVGHVNKKMKTENSIAAIREAYRNTKDLETLRIEPNTQLKKPRFYSVKYPGPTYGIIAIACNGRVIVKGHQNSVFAGVSGTDNITYPRIGSVVVAANGYSLP